MGGVVGRGDTGTALQSYWGSRSDMVQMMSRDTYAAWSDTGVWTLDDGYDYPHLLWEQAPGSLIGDVPHDYDGGSGYPGDPYLIRTAEQFVAIGYRPGDFDRSFLLTSDIDWDNVDCNGFLPIGSQYIAFSGEFDGGSHVLSNLTIARGDEMAAGIFGVLGAPAVFPQGEEIHYSIEDDGAYGWVYRQERHRGSETSPAGTIRNLHLRNVAISGGQYVGGLVGLSHGTVLDCSVEGKVDGFMVGGLVGRSLGGTIAGCDTNVQVTGEFGVGGLMGSTFRPYTHTDLVDCNARGRVKGQLHTGGLVGSSQSDVISCCAALCEVQGRSITGGCIGAITGTTLAMSHARGSVMADGRITGGFAGEATRATLSDCYYQGNTAGGNIVGGFIGRGYEGQIGRCYTVSAVTASNPDPALPSVGAFIGYMGRLSDNGGNIGASDLSGSFWNSDVADLTLPIGNTPAIPGSVIGLPEPQMNSAAPFLAAGWDFRATWTICEGQDYPRLRWEGVECP